jgi:hypothetical protein
MNETSIERRRRRVKKIRSRIAAGAAALFIAVFGGITVQLASGHDPALSASSAKAGTSTTSTTTAKKTTARSTSPSMQQPAKALSPVTTSQS